MMVVVIRMMRIPQKVTQISPSSCLDSIWYTAWEPEGLRWGGGVEARLEDEGSGARKSANVLTHPPGLGEAPGPGTVRTFAVSLRASLFCLEVNYFPFGGLVNIKR